MLQSLPRTPAEVLDLWVQLGATDHVDRSVSDYWEEERTVETPPCLIRAQVEVDPFVPRSPRQVTELVQTLAQLTLEHPGEHHLTGMIGEGLEPEDHYEAFIASLPERHPARGHW